MSGPAPAVIQAPSPVTVTSALEAIWAGEGEPILVAVLAASGPAGAAIASILNAPVIGGILTSILNSGMNLLIAAGVIEIKIGIINFLSVIAQSRWANELVILRQVQAAGKIMTPDQQAAYDAALQSLVSSHPGVVQS